MPTDRDKRKKGVYTSNKTNLRSTPRIIHIIIKKHKTYSRFASLALPFSFPTRQARQNSRALPWRVRDSVSWPAGLPPLWFFFTNFSVRCLIYEPDTPCRRSNPAYFYPWVFSFFNILQCVTNKAVGFRGPRILKGSDFLYIVQVIIFMCVLHELSIIRYVKASRLVYQLNIHLFVICRIHFYTKISCW